MWTSPNTTSHHAVTHQSSKPVLADNVCATREQRQKTRVCLSHKKEGHLPSKFKLFCKTCVERPSINSARAYSVQIKKNPNNHKPRFFALRVHNTTTGTNFEEVSTHSYERYKQNKQSRKFTTMALDARKVRQTIQFTYEMLSHFTFLVVAYKTDKHRKHGRKRQTNRVISDCLHTHRDTYAHNRYTLKKKANCTDIYQSLEFSSLI